MLQIYRKDFPSFYFPEGMDLFQLFCCPNFNCPEAFGDRADLKVFPYYFGGLPVDRNKDLAVPTLPAADPNLEGPVPDCRFEPVVVPDYPAYDDYPGRAWQEIESKLGKAQADDVSDKYYPRVGTKFGGYPHWEQWPQHPVCSCGRTKESFFQLSSEEPERSRATTKPVGEWSPHGIMIGDLGNIYFFVCRHCGLKSIETCWDCG